MRRITIEMLCILLIGVGLFYWGYKYKDQQIVYETITETDTIYAKGEIDTIWVAKTRLDTITIETVVQGETITITKIDTIYVNQKQSIAKMDTIFISSDSLVRSNVEIQYNITDNMFKIRNTFSYSFIKPQKDTVMSRKYLDGIVCAFGDENSLELGFGGLYWISDRIGLGLGYTTNKKYMTYFTINFF